MAGSGTIAIGSFARLTGLSVTRLRRYHTHGILVPARVDDRSGYRSYSPDQIAIGRRIARLRRADLPLEDLARVVAGTEAATSVLQRHQRRLAERARAIQDMTELVDQLIREEQTTMPTTSLQLMEVILRTDDVDATVAFYRDVFGMEFQPDDHNGTLPVHYDACGGSWDPEGFFMFTIYPAEGQPSKANIGFGVSDVDAIWERAQSHGATPVTPPSDSNYMPRQAIFEDNAGNRVNIYQRAGDW